MLHSEHFEVPRIKKISIKYKVKGDTKCCKYILKNFYKMNNIQGVVVNEIKKLLPVTVTPHTLHQNYKKAQRRTPTDVAKCCFF